MSRSDTYLKTNDFEDPELIKVIGQELLNGLAEEMEMIDYLFEPFHPDLYRDGYQAPVFFGSALNNFGIPELFETFLNIAPSPSKTKAKERIVEPDEMPVRILLSSW